MEYRQNTKYSDISRGWDESKHPRNALGEFTDAKNAHIDSLSDAHYDNLKAQKQLDCNSVENDDVARLYGQEYSGVKGIEAIELLLRERQGHVQAAFHRDDIGDIDLIWGNENIGMQHIIDHRNEQGIDGESFIKEVAGVLENGVLKYNEKRGNYEILWDGKIAVVAPEYHGIRITYLLTAYRTRKKVP